MQQLHLVGFTTDRRALIFSVRRGAKSGSYTVAVDDALFDAIDDARAWLSQSEEPQEEVKAAVQERPQSQLSVREVQARLRRGMSIEEVAATAGVEPSWVARFAAPVLTEQAEVIRAVRASRFVKQRIGTSGAPLGDSVYRNLVERGLSTPREELDRQWRARQLIDGLWEVSFRYTFRKREQVVCWAYDATTGKISARDRMASQLAFRPGGPPQGREAGRTRSARPTIAEDERTPAQKAKPSKRVAAVRKAAAARMVADAQKATKRDAAVVRKAAKRPAQRIALAPAPEEPDPGADEAEFEPLVALDVGVEVVKVDVVERAAVEIDVLEDAKVDRDDVDGDDVDGDDVGVGDERTSHAWDLGWSDATERPDDAAQDAANDTLDDDDAPSAPRRRGEPLRARATPSAAPDLAPEEAPAPAAHVHPDDPQARPVLRVRADPPVFRSDLAQPAADGNRPPLAPAEVEPRRRRRRQLRAR